MEQLKLNIAVLANPYVLIGAAVVAAVALIIYNWDKIVAYFSSGDGAGTWAGLKESFDVVVEYVQAAWTAFVGIIQMIWDEFGDNFLFAIQNVMDLVMRVFRGIFGVIGNLFNAFSSLFKGDWRAFLGYIGNITVEILQMVVGVFLGFLAQVGNAVDAVLGALGVDSNLGGFLKGIQQTSDKFFESIKYKGDEATAAVTDFSKALDKIPAAPVISKKLATPAAGGEGGGAAAAGQRPADMVGLTARGPAKVPNALPERGLMAPTDNTALVAAFMNEQAVAKARENLLSIQQILDNLGSSMAQVGEQFGAALGGIITGAEGAAEAMKGVARAAIDAAFNAATALAIQAAGQTAVGSGPAAAIVLPALITAGMALVKSVFTNLVGLATGGLTTGPMLAMIGDNPSGKEAVIPFERMGEFLDMAGANQPSNVTVTGRISGRDIMLSNERSSRDRKRIR
jgi:phage-related protein